MQNSTYHPKLLQQKRVPYLLLFAILANCFFIWLIIDNRKNTSEANLIIALLAGVFSVVFISFILFQLWKGLKLLNKAEREVGKSEEKYRNIIDNVASVVFSINLDGKFNFVSKRGFELTGYAPEELVGEHFTAILDPMWVDKVAKNYFSQYEQMVNETIYEFPIICKNGYRKWVEQCAVLMMENNRAIGFHCVVRDISDKKQIQVELEETEQSLKHQQHQLQAVLDNTTSLIYIKDLQGKYTVANKRFMDILQVTKKDVIGFTDYHFSSKEDADHFAELDAQVIRERKPVEVEQIIQGPEGPINLLSIKFPLFDQNNNVFGVSGIATDITERTQFKNELIVARQTAENAKLLQEQFLANMSHEIRTPMNGIQGMTNLLLETTLNDTQKNYATIIKRSVNNLLVIINDILDFSKIQAGKLTIEEIGFNLREAVNAFEPMFAHRLQKKHLEMEVNVDESVPNYLIGDPYRLNQILVNLLGNAIKFTEAGKVSLNISLVKQEGGSGTIQFTVKDTGIGIPQDKLKSVFDSFSQAGNDVARKYGGTGLGLTISKQLVELQHGSIAVKSAEGFGSEFIFQLPFKFASANDVIGLHRIQDVDFAGILAGSRVLIAEDNYVNQILIEHVLGSVGIKPIIVNNGKEAIAKLKEEKAFDVILMDLQMPIMDGYKTTAYIRNTLKINTPIVAMTATAMKGELEKCIEAGMTDYMSKPFEFIDLYKKLCKVLNKKIMQAEEQNSLQPVPEMDATLQAVKPYDLSMFEKIMKKKDLIALLEPLYKNLVNDSNEIENYSKSEQWEKASAVAHKLKSSVGYIKATELFKTLQKIEMEAVPEQDKNLVRNYIETMKTIANDLILHLEKEIKDISTDLAVAC